MGSKTGGVRSEKLPNERFELPEREDGVLGIEGGLVPLVGESFGSREPGLVHVPRAQRAAFAEVLVVMPPLKILMRLHDAIGRLGNVGLQDLGGDGGVVGDGDVLSDVV